MGVRSSAIGNMLDPEVSAVLASHIHTRATYVAALAAPPLLAGMLKLRGNLSTVSFFRQVIHAL
jgi:hypothetical protein